MMNIEMVPNMDKQNGDDRARKLYFVLKIILRTNTSSRS